MSLWSSLGTAAGLLVTGGNPAGGAIGGALGGLLDGGKKNTQLDDYTAYKLQREQKWEAMFGPIEENLVSHYNNLSATNYIAQGNEALEQQYTQSQQRLKQELANRGLNLEGGISLGATNNMLQSIAKSKADLYASADDYVAQQQQQFYATMAGAKPNASGAVSAQSQQDLAWQKYNDQQEQAAIAGVVDIYDRYDKWKTDKTKTDTTTPTNPTLNSTGAAG